MPLTPAPSRALPLRPAEKVGATAGLFALLAWGGITLSANPQHFAAVWLSNAVLLGALLRAPRSQGAALLAACSVASIAANLLSGVPIGRALGFTALNIAEAGAAFLLLARGRDRWLDLANIGDLLRFSLVAGLAVPTCTGFLAMLLLSAGTGDIRWAAWPAWSVTAALGLLIGTPLVIAGIDALRADAPNLGRRSRQVGLGEEGVVMLVGLGGAAAVFAQPGYPLLFLIGPLVVLAAFRLGTAGTALMIAGIAVIGIGLTAAGHGPIALLAGGMAIKLLILQLFLFTCFAMGLPVSALLAGLARTRAELKQRRDFGQSMLENMREVIFRSDARGRWLFLNPAWESLTGFSVADSLGRPVGELLHPDDVAGAQADYARIRLGELPETLLCQRFHTADGACRHVEVSVRSIWAADGRYDGAIGNIRDVTERVEADAALRESERRFEALASHAPVGLFRMDHRSRLVDVNAHFLDLTGLTRDEAMGQRWVDALLPEERTRIVDAFVANGNRPVPGAQDLGFRRRDGSVRWLHTSGAPLVGDDGAITGYIGINIDVTERRRAEANLAASEAQLQLLATNATDAVFRLALDGRCLYASPSVGEVIGIDPRHLVGFNMIDRFHPDDDAAVRATWARLRSGETDRGVLTYRSRPMDRPDSWRWLEANCGLVRDEAGAPAEVIVSIRDITDRKALELDLAAARDEAQVAAQAKADFLANMSHEIRTPMNGVIGFTELLLASEVTAEQRRYLRMVAESGRAMMRLLNDILDLSKIEAGHMMVAAEPIDVCHSVRGCLQLMVPQATRKGLTLDWFREDAVPEQVLGDDLRVRQILLNLLGNAVKFTAEGTVGVYLRVTDAGRLEIEVRDTGIGIAPERREKIFEQFVQADVSIARQYGGTGLGLTISGKLARLLGGELRVESVVGVGTSFFLCLPLRPVAGERTAAPAPAPTPLPAVGLSGPRVLLAEDHEINQLLTGAMLDRLGCRVTVARDGAEAIAAVAAAGDDPFQLVLMDMQMPHVDGLEATRRIRSVTDADTLPIVALTANAFGDDVEACLAAGMQGHLAKPLQMAQLAETLREWTGARSARAA